MNITKDLIFDLTKPSVLSLVKREYSQVFAVGLLKDQVLAKHKTTLPAVLLVLEGSVTFKMKDEVLLLNKFDVFHIPVDVEHEVIGIENRNSFVVIK